MTLYVCFISAAFIVAFAWAVCALSNPNPQSPLAKGSSTTINVGNDAWRTASLKFVSGRLIFPSSVFPSRWEIDQAKSRLVQTKQWADTITDKRMRHEVLGWCGYAEDCIKNAEDALREKQDVRAILSHFQN